MSQYSRYTTDCQSLTRHFFISFSIVHTNKICLIHIYSGIQSKLKCTIVWIHKSSPALFFFIFPSWNQIQCARIYLLKHYCFIFPTRSLYQFILPYNFYQIDNLLFIILFIGVKNYYLNIFV